MKVLLSYANTIDSQHASETGTCQLDVLDPVTDHFSDDDFNMSYWYQKNNSGLLLVSSIIV